MYIDNFSCVLHDKFDYVSYVKNDQVDIPWPIETQECCGK